MKVAYVTVYDSRDVHSWSGTAYFMAESLRRSGLRVEPVGPLRQRLGGLLALKELAYRRLGDRLFVRDRSPIALGHYARQVERALAEIGPDVVLTPNTVALARLRTEVPIVLWTDATFAGLAELPGRRLCRESLRDGHRMEWEALSKCRLALYASAWAAGSACERYGVDPRRVKVVPLGANLARGPDREEVETLVRKKDLGACTLLFIGRDWAEKGGDVALETAALLNRRGLPTELHVVGCEPPRGLPDFVRAHGFLSKATESGRDSLTGLFRRAHFLILPTRVECFGIVLAEASAFGVPSLARDVAGTSSAVTEGRNGKLFRPEQGAEAYAGYVLWLLASEERYRALALSSYEEHATRLNWSTIGRRVRELLHEACAAA